MAAAAIIACCRSSLVNTKSITKNCHHHYYIRQNASPFDPRKLQQFEIRPITTTKDHSSSDREIMTTTTNTNATTIPLHVLGCGSIGLLLSASIRRTFPDYPITMLLRSHHRHGLLRAHDGNYDDDSTNVNELPSSSSSIRRDEQQQHQRRYYINASITSPLEKTTTTSSVTIPAEIINDDDDHYNDITPSSSSSPPTKEENNIHHVLLCTKAHDASRAINSILPRLAPKATITIVCNGALAVKDEICNSLPNNDLQWIMAATTHGAHRHGNDISTTSSSSQLSSSSSSSSSLNHSTYHVTHAGRGTISVAHPNLAHLLSHCGLRGRYVAEDDMRIELWRKLAVNAAVNPLTARDGCRNGDLFSCERRRGVMKEIVAEVAIVAARCCCRRSAVVETKKKKKGFSSSQELMTTTTTSTTLTAATDLSCCSSMLSYSSLWSYVETVVRNTAENKSSMLQDVLAERGPTEIDYLNGYVVRMGRRYGITTRANEEICREIRALVRTFGM